MKASDFVKLEKDYLFKKDYLNKTPWWKSVLLVPPTLFLFAGLVGILYLFNYDMLVSWYIIPYLLLFVIGTIWLKAIKKHIQKTKIDTSGSFLVCVGKEIEERGGDVYIAFVTDSRRHNLHYLNTPVKEISLDDILEKYDPSILKKKSVLIGGEEEGTSMYVRAFSNSKVKKANAKWQEEGYLPILFIDERYTFIIKRKDILNIGN